LALSFSFVEPEEARTWVDEYYAIIESDQCQPIGFAVNPNVAVVVPFMCHADEQTAIERGIDGAHFFGYSLAHYYVFGEHQPGRTNLWQEFQRDRDKRGFSRGLITASDAPLPVRLLQETMGSLRGAIGTPKQVTELVERYEQAGVDEVIFVSQAGRNLHEHICESIELFSHEVLPRFAERRGVREAEKQARLTLAIERALSCRAPPRQLAATYTIWPDREPWHHVSANGHAHEPLRLRRSLVHAFGWLLEGRTDAQLERIFGSAVGQALIFRGLQRAFEAGRSDGLYGTLQYHLDGRTSTRSWLVRVADGHLQARPGVDPHPTATLRMSAATFARMAAGQQTAAAAAMTGKLQLDGDLKLVARFGEVLQPQS